MQKSSTIEPVDIADGRVTVPDLPEAAIGNGYLAELLAEKLTGLPRSYAWHALVCCAGALVPRSESLTNLYVSLVGDTHSGKSQTIIHSRKAVGLKPPVYLGVNPGSAEGLVENFLNCDGAARLLNPDELGELLAKAQIKNASFNYVLCSLYNKTQGGLTVQHRKWLPYNCRLSLIGGVVTDRFGDTFGAGSMGGLYDRFLFALAPSGFVCTCQPLDDEDVSDPEAEETPEDSLFNTPPGTGRVPVRVKLDASVWAKRNEWIKDGGMNPRIVEHVLRVATICAAWDNQDVLKAADLGPAFELAMYQTHVRELLQPNEGENADGKLALAILAYLERVAPPDALRNCGDWVNKRSMFAAIHAYRYGAGTAERAVTGLVLGGEIETRKQGAALFVRRVYPE